MKLNTAITKYGGLSSFLTLRMMIKKLFALLRIHPVGELSGWEMRKEDQVYSVSFEYYTIL